MPTGSSFPLARVYRVLRTSFSRRDALSRVFRSRVSGAPVSRSQAAFPRAQGVPSVWNFFSRGASSPRGFAESPLVRISLPLAALVANFTLVRIRAKNLVRESFAYLTLLGDEFLRARTYRDCEKSEMFESYRINLVRWSVLWRANVLRLRISEKGRIDVNWEDRKTIIRMRYFAKGTNWWVQSRITVGIAVRLSDGSWWWRSRACPRLYLIINRDSDWFLTQKKKRERKRMKEIQIQMKYFS